MPTLPLLVLLAVQVQLEPLPNSFHTGTKDLCKPVHSRSWGITLACCSAKTPLSEHCKYNTPHMCKFPHCACTVIVDVDSIRCSDDSPRREWKDHEVSPDDHPFQCRNPNFPNENGEFLVTLKMNSKSLTVPFLLGLSKYRITELALIFESGGNHTIQEDLFDYFRLLTILRIFHSSLHATSLAHIPFSVGRLDRLEMLSLVNLSSLIHLHDKVLFTSSLRYLLIQNCPQLDTLPEWFTELQAMSYLKITQTSVESIAAVAALTALSYLYLPSNKINDISRLVFESENLQELDLSSNEICCIETDTFSKLTQLRYLDLSDNQLKRLPSGGFANTGRLQWLYLRHKLVQPPHKKTQQIALESLDPDNLAGLRRLEYLSLENNPNISIHHQAFASLPSLKSLDLSYCNLTTIPDSVIHLCELRYLWLKFNRLHYSYSIPPSTLSMLPLHDLLVMDVSENSQLHNPYSLFLIPLDNTALIESVISSMKPQPLWWRDQCARKHWRTRLINSNPNATQRSFYSKLLEEDGRSLWHSTSNEEQCDALYKKIIRELAPYETMKESSVCSRLIEQRRINRRFRQHLLMIQSVKNATINACRPVSINRGCNEASDGQWARESENRQTERPEIMDRTKNEREQKGVKNQNQGTILDGSGNIPPMEEEDTCGHLYATIDILGYVLAANFAIVICVSSSCIILLCKRRRGTVDDASDGQE